MFPRLNERGSIEANLSVTVKIASSVVSTFGEFSQAAHV